ncbi:MAG: hypothetical protein H6Q73_3611 [Firmicutes bacterium]|nr:hypothetical protein [Bacillota bacterium]
MVESGRIADSFFSRFKGLLFTKSLPRGAGLIIKPCKSIHTIGMAYTIDVLFISADNNIIKAVPEMRACRVTACMGSDYVLELGAGTLVRTGTQVGDKLELLWD